MEAEQPIPGVSDWSTVHQPISNKLYTPIKDKSEYGKYKFSKEQVDQFWRDGYISNIPIFTPEQCDAIIEDYKYFMDPDKKHPGHEMLYEHHHNQSTDENTRLMHCLGHWRLTELFHDAVFHPKVIVPVSQLLVEGKEVPVRFWHDQLFAKPPKHGGVVAWHQDYSYWTRTGPMMHATVHIALEDQTEENGTLLYIPGSHRWTREGGKPLPVLDFNFTDMEGIKTILTPEELAQFKPVPSLLKKGEASFHHALSVHGSYGNKSNTYRRAAVLNYFADGVLSQRDENQIDGLKRVSNLFTNGVIPKGQKMQGQFFPLVYDPAWTK